LFDGEHSYEHRIGKALALYLITHFLMLRLRRFVGPTLSTRPTVVCGTIHAVGTALAASVLLVMRDYGAAWQRAVLPFSIAYFLADVLWYCLPARDLTMSLHHLVMIGCHYPIGEINGALVAGAGDSSWCIWLSMIGYLSEWTTALLNMRWLLAHSYPEHRCIFTMVSGLLLVTYFYRLLLFPYLLIFEIIPRYSMYSTHQQVLTFFIMILGHLIVLQLSIQWAAVIFKCGVVRFLNIVPKAKGIGEHGDLQFDWRQSVFAPTQGSVHNIEPSNKREQQKI